METNIQPVVKFYVKKFDSKVGAIVNYQSFSVEAGVIDFTEGAGLGHYTASITHKQDGGWDVNFFV
ncbi:hypothetical protein FVEG_15281 [Fusarium verticillioides 7600]|uniref:Uncharacterized protein n=1 Tax=Gibberella moniliformis (strain M3125 / FGSC 7600) TaxID=334819 RepID=W7LS22_GIBM7|nr:hypothetical protein FVEG_15281 [Fusarium verticillioides 7600]EWG41361.1 hypothetical protein FVEG_15281 [Fusarium verticillioides 7600]